MKRGDKGLQGVKKGLERGYRGIQEVPRGDKGLERVTGGDKGLQRITRVKRGYRG